MKKMSLILLPVVMLIGCASVPSNFKQRAISEFSIDVKIHSMASNYYPGVYGFSDLKSNILVGVNGVKSLFLTLAWHIDTSP